MSFIWVTKPGQELSVSQSLSEKIDKAQAFINSIEALSQEGVCHLCGRKEVSREHTPSRAAFNSKDLIALRIAKPLQNFLRWVPEIQQGGNVNQSLCRLCNNQSGAWYNPAYVKLARACYKIAQESNANQHVEVKVNTYPVRILKQALVHLVASSQPGLTEKYPLLREFLINKENSLEDVPFRMGLYARVNKGSRSTGVAFGANFQEEAVEISSEFSFWPLGWVLAFEGTSLDDLTDVTSWGREGYYDKKEIEVMLPCHWAIQAYPRDFRSPEQIAGSKKDT